jgi:hypothetical protein
VLPIAPKALGFTPSSRAAGRLVALALLVVALTASWVGTGVLGSSSASASTESTAALRESEASDCADQAEGPPSATVALLVCTDLDADLVGIANLLGLPALAPTAHALTTPVEIVFSPTPALTNSDSAYMETKYFGSTSDPEPCQVVLYPKAWKEFLPNDTSVPADIHVLLSHEAVHCYQHDVISYDEYYGDSGPDKVPLWISEGSATYVATLYAGPEPGTPTFWCCYGWLGIPNKTLTGRSYDAVGWYAMVARATGTSLLPKFASAWRAFIDGGDSNDAYIKALGGDSPAVEAAWAPSLLHAPQWGDAWDTPGVGVPTGLLPTTVDDSIVQQDVPVEVPIVPDAAVVDFESTVTDGLVEVSIDHGLASVHDGGSTDELDFTDQIFCVGKACDNTEVTCQSKPGKKTPEHITPIPLTVPFFVAAGGSDQAATLTMESMSVPDSPTPTQLPKGAGPCDPAGPKPPPKPGSDLGDPHLQALNGGSYDFQGAGEYTLVRSQSGDVDVQVRAAPAINFRGGASRYAAWNTAVAMRVVSTDVEIDAGNPVIVRINGKSIGLAKLAQRTLDGGGLLTYRSNGPTGDLVASWPDGSSLNVFADSYAENATFTPPKAGVDNLTGLLSAWEIPKPGKASSRLSSETLIGGDGRRYVIDPTTAAGFKALYGPFAATWHVTKRTSLFTYPKGKSTSSYDVKGFPKFGVPSDLSPQKKAKVEAICKADGVTAPRLLDDCQFDVAETGQTNLGTKTTGAQPATGGNGTQHPASYYFTHPCEAVTPAGIKQALGVSDPGDSGSGSDCDILGTGAAVDFSHQSVASFKSHYPGTAGSGPVPSLGHEAYCVVSPGGVASESDVVASLGSAGSLQVLADDCTQATALAKDALSHISGL